MANCGGCGVELPPRKRPGGAPRKWCSEHCRKGQYAGACVDCGASTNGHDGPGMASERCLPCDGQHRQEMSRRWILESFQEWAEMFGAPPASTDWNPALCRSKGMGWKVRRHGRTGRAWPSVSLVQENFGSWNGGVRAAGFEPIRPSDYPLGRHGEALRDAEAIA